MSGVQSSLARSPEVGAALRTCLPWFAGVALFSAVVNVLYLSGSLYMMQVYDRVLTSKSVATLVGLSVILLVAFALQGTLDGLRARMLARIGARFDEILSARVYQVVAALPLRGLRGAETMMPVRDLDQIRAFLSGLGPTALFDLPFLPIFLLFTFALHPWLGWVTVFGGVMIVALTLLTEARSRRPALAIAEAGALRQNMIEATRRNAEAIAALGMRGDFQGRYTALNDRHVAETLRASDIASGIGSAAKMLRQILQSASLGVGAYLAILGEISTGSIIAASILTSRALAPIEVAVAHWKGFVAARQGYRRLGESLALVPKDEARLAMPPPQKHVAAEDILVAPPGQTKLVLNGVSLRLASGDAIGIIGPTGCGKSTLARALVGVWPIQRGHVRLDGAALDQWGEALGSHIGYLPQDIELFQGTVAENIARFSPQADPQAVLSAAADAGAHEMILQLRDGYDTRIGEGGAALSGGQRQRIALARALYGDPFLVVLDEPNANLDNEGEEALSTAIRLVRGRGGIVIVITHRPAGLAAVNLVAILKDGRIATAGPRDEVLQALVQPVPSAPLVQGRPSGPGAPRVVSA